VSAGREGFTDLPKASLLPVSLGASFPLATRTQEQNLIASEAAACCEQIVRDATMGKLWQIAPVRRPPPI
jgi:hypothetical protein